VNSKDWDEFETIVDDVSILAGKGNMDIGYDTVGGKPWEGRTIRLFNPQTRLWSLYWVESNKVIMDPPVVGSFHGSVGKFYGRDTYNGKAIIFMFRWDKTDPEHPVWSQAFSTDNGKTWEWNWSNTSYRIK
jgi:hypothetical protein